MSFYNDLSKVYDIVFPAAPASLDFIVKNLNSKSSKVLDIACGIGEHCKKVSTHCLSISGLDYEPEMIEIAKSKNASSNVSYSQGDMLKLEDSFPGQYDLIYCIGNSIVHLPSPKEIQEFLSSCYKKLNTGGELIVQTINYDRIFKDNVKSLPIIENSEKKVFFERLYNYESNQQSYVNFDTTLKIGDSVYKNSIKLYALKQEDFKEMLINAGFTDFDFYGDFKESEYSEKSYATVVRAKK